MKLELKHLAPYLPYELKIDDTMTAGYSKKLMTPSEDVACFISINSVISRKVKPILRPLSDLTKDTGGGNYVDVISTSRKMTEKLVEIINNDGFRHERLRVWQSDILIKEHFDIFGLIDAGLAIDYNTLKDK